jgi:pyruvate,water dikinase
VARDQHNHVYVSVGHQQMMTDPMKPLGISLWQLTAFRPMHEAGGRLFVDVTEALASSTSRAGLLEALGRSDPLIGDALETVLGRGDIVGAVPDDGSGRPQVGAAPAPPQIGEEVIAQLVKRSQESIATLKAEIGAKCGPELFDFILADVQELKRILFDPQSLQVIRAAMEATWWLNEQLEAWLGEKNAAGALTQSAPNNVTSEMGLKLLDVADVVRPYPALVAFLEDVKDDRFLDELPKMEGGHAARAALQGYLDTYGMRCVGEIDITRPRWSEHPMALVPMVLSNIKNFEPGARERLFAQGRQDAEKKQQELLARLGELADGKAKADEAKRMIELARSSIGYREFPKYAMVSRYFIYKQALLEEADRLVRAKVLRDRQDIYYLTFDELGDLVRTKQVDNQLIAQRKDAYRTYQALTPPRVITSDGEVVAGTYRKADAPAGALVGLAVSAGTVEGRARVISDIAQADLEAGDILVTTYADPSWTPVLVAIAGLVTEVGGLMTHGAVIAREYGLPAVVGVEHATQLVPDGKRIRVNGTAGYVEVLPEP